MEENHKKFWKLELTNYELTILQIAVERFAQKYEGDVFSSEELASTLQELWTYKTIES
jgi:hypothetical protein